MNEGRSQEPGAITKTTVGRRGLLGILGALGVGLAAKKLAEPEGALAADGGTFTATPPGGNGVVATGNEAGVGVHAVGGTSGHGVLGVAGGPGRTGVLGFGAGFGAGIQGVGGGESGAGGDFSGGGPNGHGVTALGAGAAAGVYGEGGSTSGTGGEFIGATPNGQGVYAVGRGIGAAVFADAITSVGPGVSARGQGPHTPDGDFAAVRGRNFADGPGVVGISTNGIGVFGYNTGSGDGDPAACGGFFTTVANNTNAMVAQVFGSVTNAAAFVGSAAPGGGRLAGYFFGDTQFSGNEQHTGNVNITGDLTVTGMKNAVVPMADGRLHRVYSMESPEAWFEDFGRGTLQRGSGRVALKPDFSQIVDASSYEVFLTERGPNQALFVESSDPGGFTVRSNTSAGGEFSYRIVAKRKDIAAPRLEAFTPPPVRTVKLNTVPPTGPAEAAPPLPAQPSAPTPTPRGR